MTEPRHEEGLATNDELVDLIESIDEDEDMQVDELNEYLEQLGDEPLEEYTAVSAKTEVARERMWYTFCE